MDTLDREAWEAHMREGLDLVLQTVRGAPPVIREFLAGVVARHVELTVRDVVAFVDLVDDAVDIVRAKSN